MKLYNPFKPHIAQFTSGSVKGKFAIRKLGIYPFFICWEYLDSADKQLMWNMPSHVEQYCLIDSIDVAKSVLQRYLDKISPIKSKVVFNG